MIIQKSFNYYFKNDLNEQNFFVNQTNIDAFDNIINQENKFIYLFGPKKSGKSFLSQIWLNKNKAVQLNDNFNFIIENKNNVLIDDLKFFNQEKIFYVVNNCILNNFKILITSDINLNEINFKFQDLPSRLKNFTSLEIKQPNDEMLLTILTKLLIDKQFVINSNEIFEYILRRVERSYLAINDIVNKLDVLTLQKKRQLTIPLIKEIL